MCCKDKRKHYCLEKVQAICTQYKGTVAECSSLDENDCLTIEETTQDIYDIIDVIKNVIDLSDITYDCITVDFEDEDNPTLKEILDKLIEEICLLKQSQGNDPAADPCEIDLSTCNINTDCLDNDPCTNGLATLPEILNSIIAKLCSLESTINNLTVCDIAVDGCSVDFACLKNDYITDGIDLAQAMQIFIDEFCTIRVRLNDLENPTP